jgi:sulfite reductase (NADPH) flavoprotein alpha-component
MMAASGVAMKKWIRKVVFEAHWLLGITAGLVIAVVGFTGGLLSFENDIKRWLNPGLMQVDVPDGARPLAPGELFEAVRRALPERRIQALTISAEPEYPARVVLAALPGEQDPRRIRRGETRYLDPYTGDLLEGEVRGEAFFHFTEDLHRRIAGGEVGKQIVGACTVVLILLALSGIYLRWPRRWYDLRIWVKPDFSRRGRALLWNLHAVIGVWVLPVYILASVTGLFWSYEWYREGLFQLAGMEAPARPGPQMGRGGARGGEAPGVAAADVDRVWEVFQEAVEGNYSTVTMRLPERPGQPVQLNWLDADPPHERANNRAAVDLALGELVNRDLYAGKTMAQRLVGSVFPLHSGSYFGLPGLIIVMIASLLMPLFVITGWMMYLDRRRRRASAAGGAGEVSKAAA